MDILSLLGGYLGDFANWVMDALRRVTSFLNTLLSSLKSVFSHIGAFFQGTWRVMRNLAHAITGIKTSGLWKELHKWYDRYHRWTDWYNKTILGPVKQIQQAINNIYNTIFAPIIKTIDSVRVMLDTLFFWNKKLREKIDSALFGLEAKVMAPYLALTRRVNELSSIATAIITNTGRFDGQIFVETLSAHLKDIIHIWGQASKNVKPLPAKQVMPSPTDLKQQFEQFFTDGTGPMAAPVQAMHDHYVKTLADMGVNYD